MIDYNEFINWYKGIEVIVNNNKKGLHKNKDERILQNIQNSKKRIVFHIITIMITFLSENIFFYYF